MDENGNQNLNEEGPISNQRGRTLRLVILVAFVCFFNLFFKKAVYSLLGIENPQHKSAQHETVKPFDKKTNTGAAVVHDPEAVKKLRQGCYDETCGINCVKDVCTVVRIYPGTDIEKRTFYNVAAKPEKMEYCIKKDRYGMCAGGGTAYYGPDGKVSALMKCNAYDNKMMCMQAGNAIHYFYDEKGNNVLKKICSGIDCGRYEYLAYAYDERGNMTAQDIPCGNYKNGKCGTLGSGDIFEYDAGNRRTSARKCNSFNPDFSCAEYIAAPGMNWKYDEKGNNIYFDECAEVNPQNGTCAALKYAVHYTYGSGKEPESAVYCMDSDENGSCKTKTEHTFSYEYDDKGNVSKKTEYIIQRNAGTSGSTKKVNYLQTYNAKYDRRGHKTYMQTDYCGKPDNLNALLKKNTLMKMIRL